MRSNYIHRQSRGIITLTPPENSPYPGWWINRVNVPIPYRRRGIADSLMLQLSIDADFEAVDLYLSVEPDGHPQSMNSKQLHAWYRGWNFRPLGTTPHQLVRPHLHHLAIAKWN